MTVEVSTSSFRHRLRMQGEDWLLLALLSVVFVLALAGAFTHMHDWTISSVNDALARRAAARGVAPPRVENWLGWTNAVMSEVMPTASLLIIRKRQRQNRSVFWPGALFVASTALSLLAQESATGVTIIGAASLLVCLPTLTLIVLATLKFSDMTYARKLAVEQEKKEQKAALIEAAAARRKELTAERRRNQEAELAAEQARNQAELAAQAAERERQRQEAAEQAERDLAAELRRRDQEEKAKLDLLKVEADIALRNRQQEAQEREQEAARQAQEAVEREKAQVLAEAEASMKRQAAALLARQAPPSRRAAGGGGDVEGRSRLTRVERAALVDAVLSGLPAGTTRDQAVSEVSARMGCTPRYAREFVPADWVGGSASGPAAAPAASSADDGQERRLALVTAR